MSEDARVQHGAKNKGKVEVTTLQYYLTMTVLIVSILSTLFSIGYNMRRVDEVYEKVTVLEQKGSVTAQLTAKDVQWIMDSLKELGLAQGRLEQKLDRHMVK
jgi:hypothetical protein